jgi:hypothetical protein
MGPDADGFTTKAVSSHVTYYVVGDTSRRQLGVAAAATCARIFDKMIELQTGGDWGNALFKSQMTQQRATWLPNATKGTGILMNDIGLGLFNQAIIALERDLCDDVKE